MKKTIALLLALSMLTCLCACGNSDSGKETTSPSEKAEDTQPANVATEPACDDCVFAYNGIDIEMNAHADGIIDALGAPKSYTEEPSCAFEGMDKTYFYSSFYLQTYPMEDVDYIYCLWIVDDSVETPEGIYIGASQAHVEEAYGADSYNGTNAYVITGKNTRLTIILDNGVVSSIQYDALI